MMRRLVKECLTAFFLKGYEKELSSRKITYDAWIRKQEVEDGGAGNRREADAGDEGNRREADAGGAGNRREADAGSAGDRREADAGGAGNRREGGTSGAEGCQPAADGQSVLQVLETSEALIFYRGGGRLAKRAAVSVDAYLEEHPEVMLAYGDEDVEDPVSGERRSPWYKPDWSPDTFLAGFYWGNTVVLRKRWLEESGRDRNDPGRMPQGILASWKEGKPSWEEGLAWFRQLAEEAGGFRRGCVSIGHIEAILYHGFSETSQEVPGPESGEDVSEEGVASGERKFPVGEEVRPAGWELLPACGEEPLPVGGKLSVIIPSRDHPELLEKCVNSLLTSGLDEASGTGAGPSWELIVVDNGSGEKNREKIRRLLDLFPGKSEYLYHPMEFNFSKMCNLGAGQAAGDFLLFLNDDVELCCKDTLGAMMRKAAQPYTGAVGLKLLYPDSKKIQHAGITNLPMGPVHKLQFYSDEDVYDHGRNRQERNVLAVTGACLMCEKRRFWEAGGFDEELRVAFNDVALCFRLRELGYFNVVINRKYAFHHESLTRGADVSVAKLDRLQEERKKLYEKHPAFLARDPYYPKGLNQDYLDTGIRPAYLTVGNRFQELAPKSGRLDPGTVREDPCLLVQVERCDEEGIWGYSVVLGDHNACYEKTLVLLPLGGEACQEGNASASDGTLTMRSLGEDVPDGKLSCYLQRLRGQYRPDLEENMPDQKEAALCGFCLICGPEKVGIPSGDYRIGVLARNLTGRGRLIYWSNRIWHKR